MDNPTASTSIDSSESLVTTRPAFVRENDCRMYRQKFPSPDQSVMVYVTKLAELGAYVQLLEYGNIEELSRRRIRSISRHIRVGRQEVCVVLTVEESKGYIDLSKRRVDPEIVTQTEERYTKSKKAHSILRYVAEKCHLSLIQLYEDFGWDLADDFGHLLTAFQTAVQNPEKVFEGRKIDPGVKTELLAVIKRKLTPAPLKFRADIEVTCFDTSGILGIKAALTAGEQSALPDFPIKISLLAPPVYTMTCQALTKQSGIDNLTRAIEKIRVVITQKKGNLIVSSDPRSVSQRDDQELSQLLEELAEQMQEVDGDDDSEDLMGDF